MPGLLERTMRHLRRGTLPRRIYERYHYLLHQRRAARWDVCAQRCSSIMGKIERSVLIRHYIDSHLSRALYMGEFEPVERAFLKAFLRPGDIFVDVGANLGLFTLLAARYVGHEGSVYAFEPNPTTFERLQDNVALNRFKRVRCIPLALSDTEANLPLTIGLEGWDAWSSLAYPVGASAVTTISTGCITWDRFAVTERLLGRVAMMKIDVEGWEAKVLSGASTALIRPDAPLLQVEFTDAAAYAAGSSCRDLYHLLEQLGYSMYRYDPTTRSLVAEPLRDTYPYVNLLAAKQPEQVMQRLRAH